MRYLRDAQNLTQISDLTLTNRIAMFDALRKGFVENLNKSKGEDEASRVAAAVEFRI